LFGVEALGFSSATFLAQLCWYFVLARQRLAFGFIAGLSMNQCGDVVLMMFDRGRLVEGFCWFVPEIAVMVAVARGTDDSNADAP